MILRHLVYSLALTLLLFHCSTAQTPDALPARTTREGREARQELERKAMALLDEVVSEAQLLKRAENRIHFQAVAAGLFWKRDEKRARALYKEAMQGVGEMMSGLDSSDPQYETLLQVAASLRQEIAQMIAEHDSRLALDLLRATPQPPSRQTDPRYGPEAYGDLQLELNLAVQVADDDPGLARQIAEESLAKGLSSTLTEIISRLMSKDREGASKLSDALIKKLQSENLLTNRESTSAALSLLSVLNDAGVTGAAEQAQNTSKETAPTVGAQSYRELLDMVVTTALSAPLNEEVNGNERNIARTCLSTLEPLLPQVERYAPERALALRRKMADYQKTIDPESRYWAEHQDLMTNGTVENLLEAAAHAPGEVRSNLYRNAASKAMAEGDESHARQIIEETISDPSERRQMIENLDQEMFWRTASEGKIDDLRRMLSKRRSNDERVGGLVQAATMVAGKGDKKSALQLMEEARALVYNRAGNSNQFQAQIVVAHAYAAFEPARSFEILESQVSQLNELFAAAEVLNGFDYEYFKEGELVLQNGTLGMILTQHINELSSLARIDFDRARLVASRFQRPETRIMAGLSIAQGALGGSPDTDRPMMSMSFVDRGNKRVPIVRF